MTVSTISSQRYHDMLTTALGEAIINYLHDDDVVEIMVNPDGRLHIDSLLRAKFSPDIIIPAERVTNIVKLVAACHNQVADELHPEVAAVLPIFDARFQGWLPPVVAQATFNIRKRAIKVFTLDDYVATEVIDKKQQEMLIKAVKQRKNIIIAGGTGSGKTTLANALLYELKDSNERIVVLEDLPELQLLSRDTIMLRTTSTISMHQLVKGVLRMRPDRIIVGEVRDGTALDLLKAWNTGHPGSLCTLHANSARDALLRLQDLICEVLPIVPEHLIQNAIDLLVFIERTESGKRQVTEILSI